MRRSKPFDVSRYLDRDDIILEYLRAAEEYANREVSLSARRNARRALERRLPRQQAKRALALLVAISKGEGALLAGRIMPNAEAKRRLESHRGKLAGSGGSRASREAPGIVRGGPRRVAARATAARKR